MERIAWDYYVRVIDHGPAAGLETALCEEGDRGYELVQIIEGRIEDRVRYVAIFKRPR